MCIDGENIPPEAVQHDAARDLLPNAGQGDQIGLCFRIVQSMQAPQIEVPLPLANRFEHLPNSTRPLMVKPNRPQQVDKLAFIRRQYGVPRREPRTDAVVNRRHAELRHDGERNVDEFVQGV